MAVRKRPISQIQVEKLVNNIINELSDQKKAILYLTYKCEMSTYEISDIIDRSQFYVWNKLQDLNKHIIHKLNIDK